PDAGLLLLFQRGIEHERKCVSSLEDVVEPDWDEKAYEAGFESTVALMKAGHPWICQGVLLNESGVGLPDLLKKTAGSSSLGDHTYIPVDVKGHKAVTKKDRYQLLGYAYLLESILGYRPSEGGIWLNTGEIAEVDLGRDVEDVEALLCEMEKIREGELVTEGYRCGQCNTCEWIDHCFSVWDENESVCLLYGVTGNLARRLAEAGFFSWKDVVRCEPIDIADQVGIKPRRMEACHLHARARDEGCPQILKPAKFPSNVPIHFYDIETFGNCVYLHGNIRVFNGEREEKQFFAKDPAEEKEAWHQYLDYLARDDEAVIYCWADYERGFANSLWERYGGNPKGWHHLEEHLIDQCKFVKDHFALPVYSYSIKRVAPVFGFKWSAEDAGGLNSEAWYKDWLETGEEAIFQKILRYNLDDVLAMEVIDRELRGIDSWIGPA
ncbi:MAG: TM0106 family RecB-like putative nuclease, partial [Deltaproteobacteria bacterium]|nr:TM0106 family RecB-like putative nuclease [Deltaproteobacteria bacterium]